ncbi:MAG: DUF962 domain-containing protein [Woeseiaceae bacterium]
MQANSKLMDMLTGYAAAHQHPFNVAVHMIGIPTIMLGVFIAFSWAQLSVFGVTINGAFITTFALFAFYFTLDGLFSLAFLLYAVPIAYFATIIGAEPMSVSGTVAVAAFVGGYIAQFVGHAVEKTAPVILKHPIQANLAAPFFTVVEVFKIAGLRDDVFNEVQRRITALQHEQTA